MLDLYLKHRREYKHRVRQHRVASQTRLITENTRHSALWSSSDLTLTTPLALVRNLDDLSVVSAD